MVGSIGSQRRFSHSHIHLPKGKWTKRREQGQSSFSVANGSNDGVVRPDVGASFSVVRCSADDLLGAVAAGIHLGHAVSVGTLQATVALLPLQNNYT